jgi:hypothetical protein
MNVDGRNCSTVKISVTAHSLKRTSSISTGTELELWTAAVSRLHMVEGRNRDCVELVLCSFHYSNKKYDAGGTTFQIIFVVFLQRMKTDSTKILKGNLKRFYFIKTDTQFVKK